VEEGVDPGRGALGEMRRRLDGGLRFKSEAAAA